MTFAAVSCIHTRKEDNIKRVLHSDMCSINLFNALLYISAGLGKFRCLFGQQGYFFAIPLTRYPATKHMASYVSSYVLFARYMEITLHYVSSQGTWKFPCTLSYMFHCKVLGNFHVPCHMFHRKVHALPYV